MDAPKNMATLGLVGARGYVGRELSELLAGHGSFDVRFAVSSKDGLTPEAAAAQKLDAYVLALPNGASLPFTRAIEAASPTSVIVDLSADNRFDDAWTYGQPERLRDRIVGARRISNPGCYATAMQLALAPIASLIDGAAHVFGVSGYSGAGTSPSPKNDPEVLRDNLLPYSLIGHVHEREVARQLGLPIFFAPHVAPFFRGITVTISAALREASSFDALEARYMKAYVEEPLVTYTKEAPLVRDIASRHHVAIGGLTVAPDGERFAVVATIDNLLGGAATQALRNLNIALGFPERQGIDDAASK